MKIIEKFINSKIIGRLRSYLHRLNSITSEDVEQLNHISPTQTLSQVFTSWLLDIVQYGLSITVIVTVFIGWQGTLKSFGLIISFGLIRWLILDSIQSVKEVTKD